MGNYKWLLWLVLLVALLVVGKLTWFKPQNQTINKQANPGQTVKPTAVEAYIVKHQNLKNTIQTAGSLIANEILEIRPEVSGKITKLGFSEGEQIPKGRLLVKLNDADLRANLNKTRAQISLATEKEQRLLKLLQIQGISKTEYDIAQNELLALKAEESVLKVMISKTEIYAPFSGKIGMRSVSVGSFVTSQNLISSLEQIDPIKIEFSIPEQYASLVKEGQSIQFNLASVTGNFEAKIYAINPSIDVNTRSLKIRAKLSNPKLTLKPGSFTEVELNLGDSQNALMVPSQSIIPILKGKQLFVVKDGKAKPTMVKTGLRTDSKVQILEGVHEGDTILTSGIMAVRPGATVNILNIISD